MDNVHEQREGCKIRFENIEKWQEKTDIRLEDGEKKFNKHDVSLEGLTVNMQNLMQSMGSLTKALWGVAGSIMVAGVGFIIWYIQNPR